MGLFSKFRSKNRSKGTLKEASRRHSDHAAYYQTPTYHNNFPPPRYDCTARLPPALVEKIFGFVCPHATDETYADAEAASQDGACPLCDMRNLAHCRGVSRRWNTLAGNVL